MIGLCLGDQPDLGKVTAVAARAAQACNGCLSGGNALVGFDQRHEHVQPLAFAGTAARVQQALQMLASMQIER